ncbi:uncharacterized protein LOC128358306 isoform X1 [Scomber scombrus]|uniref:Zona pellucida sperm-binding protein 4 n=1 Tax=Scomber scombrus TaxID=13677 RepID=A0AAV1PLM3_SCOSC
MAKCWSPACLVALALLGCLVGPEVEAQESTWLMSKGSPPPQGQQDPQPSPPKITQYPQNRQNPQIQLPSSPKTPGIQYPQNRQNPQVQHPSPQKTPGIQYPQNRQSPQVQHPSPQKTPGIQYPQNRQSPQVQLPSPPNTPGIQYPQNHQNPKIQPWNDQFSQDPQTSPPKSQYPQNRQNPQVHLPSPPKTPGIQYPQNHQNPKIQPWNDQFSQDPQTSPPKSQYPQNRQNPQVHLPSPPKTPGIQYPQNHQNPKIQPWNDQFSQDPQTSPPKSQYPQNRQNPQVHLPSPPKTPGIQYPQNHQNPKIQPGNDQFSQDPQTSPPKSQYPQNRQNPQVALPSPPKTTGIKYPQNRQIPQVQLPSPPMTPGMKYPQNRQNQQFSPRAYASFQSSQNSQDPQTQQPQKQEKPDHPWKPQNPINPQKTDIPNTSEPMRPESCEVERGQRIPCGPSEISSADCQNINCCFDGQQCYYGKMVTVQCTKDAQFIVVVARDATLPNLDLESISLLGEGQGCTHVGSNSEFAIYQFPVTGCGSVVMEASDSIYYENRMSSSYEVGVGPLGAITRDSHFEFIFRCMYIGTSVETVVAEVFQITTQPLPVAALGPILVQLRLANGQCHTKGCNEADAAYNSFYTEADYPVVKVLRLSVFVEVELMDKTDPMLVLTLGRCWTTTSPNPHSMPQWDLLIDGCPYRDDRYISSLVPVDSSSGLLFPSHFRRFIFKMFTFVDTGTGEPMKELVCIHCSTAVCPAAPGRSCEPSCSRKARDVGAVDQRREEPQVEPKVVVSVGPVEMTAAEEE